MSDNTIGSGFQDYMRLVDAHLEKLCGLSHMDLPDYGYHDAYTSGEDPLDVAVAVLEDNDFPFEEEM